MSKKGINTGKENGMYSHGMLKTKFYRHWRIMKNRCVSKAKEKYYGSHGVCKRWSEFIPFYEDMYSGYQTHSKKHKYTTLDRIDNDKGYSKENCRWATPKEQANNRNNNVRYKYNGKLYTISELAVISGVPYPALRERLKKGRWPIEKCMIQGKFNGRRSI